jgi:hypothetical protein
VEATGIPKWEKIFFFCNTEVWTYGSALARQVLYHLSLAPKPSRSCLAYCPGPNQDSPKLKWYGTTLSLQARPGKPTGSPREQVELFRYMATRQKEKLRPQNLKLTSNHRLDFGLEAIWHTLFKPELYSSVNEDQMHPQYPSCNFAPSLHPGPSHGLPSHLPSALVSGRGLAGWPSTDLPLLPSRGKIIVIAVSRTSS